jgi:hypothetical protein
MVLGSMILMGANPFLGPLEGVGPEYLDIFGSPIMALALLVAISGLKEFSILRALPFQWPL